MHTYLITGQANLVYMYRWLEEPFVALVLYKLFFKSVRQVLEGVSREVRHQADGYFGLPVRDTRVWVHFSF
jgi:hypothetical protein